MRISLIVATLNRVDPLETLLASLQSQTFQEFDVWLVDQNNDDRLLGLIAKFSERLSIRRVVSPRGASRARNAGLVAMQAAKEGDIVAFPDDDCWYPPDLLERVSGVFAAHPKLDGVTGRPCEDRFWDTSGGRIDRYNVWKRGIEFAMFFRRRVVDRVGLFDERLGPGSGTEYWAGEGADYLLRAIEQGFTLDYDPSMGVHHPSSTEAAVDHARYLLKSYHYALAKGRVLAQRRFPKWFVVYQWMRPVAGAAMAMARADRERARLYWSVARGIAKGSWEVST